MTSVVARATAVAAAATLLTGGPAAQSERPATSPPLSVALEAAKWIRTSAIRRPEGTVWPADPRDSKTVNTSLYSGTPGVVLFFLEANRATGSPEFLDDARAGADYLMSVVDTTTDTGLYTGLAGIGFTLSEVSRVTKDAKYRAGAEHVIARLESLAHPAGAGIEWSPVTDIISGSAGTGLFLLYASHALSSTKALELAKRAGARLVEVGLPFGDGGLKWELSPGYARNYPNFSHGTAGVAYFLATLAKETSDRASRDAALKGAAYLKSIASTEGDVCLIFHDEPGDAGRNLYYLGWCHGPAGTARLWYQLYRITNDREWLTWAERSARGILKSGIPDHQTPGFWNNVSACCGSTGVASFFLAMHQVTGRSEYLTFSRHVTDELLSKATRDAAGARWVQAENRVSPDVVVAQTGWMQGAAGIGAWLLRLDAFDRHQAPRIKLPDDPF